MPNPPPFAYFNKNPSRPPQTQSYQSGASQPMPPFPSPMQQPPAPPMQFVPPGVDPGIAEWFQTLNRSRSGRIDVLELHAALSVTYKGFSYATVERLISMYDVDCDGGLDVAEFQACDSFIKQMQGGFHQRDTDRSGRLSGDEVQAALKANGFEIDEVVFQCLMRTFDRRKVGTLGFDNYIDISMFIGKARDTFHSYAQGKDTVTFNFNSFLMSGLALL